MNLDPTQLTRQQGGETGQAHKAVCGDSIEQLGGCEKPPTEAEGLISRGERGIINVSNAGSDYNGWCR